MNHFISRLAMYYCSRVRFVPASRSQAWVRFGLKGLVKPLRPLSVITTRKIIFSGQKIKLLIHKNIERPGEGQKINKNMHLVPCGESFTLHILPYFYSPY